MIGQRIIKVITISVVASILVLNFPIRVLAEGPIEGSDTTLQTQANEEIKNTQPTEDQKTEYTQDQTGHWNSDEWTYDPVSKTYQPTVKPEVTIIDTNSKEVNNKVTATNNIESDAKSGDASVDKNTVAGDAKTGNASSTATVMNTVNATLSLSNNKEVASFVKDVTGDVNGDIILQPLLLKAMLESNPTSSNDYASVTNKTTLTNNINLNATSGNASVTNNTQAGSAKTGEASTVANVVNIINSMISAKQSFVGTINIYGNLNGDILIAPDFIPQLLESNGKTSEPVGTATIDTKDTQSIVNNVSLAAESGKAAVLNNTQGGSATTGNASTNVVIFNLTGHEIIASNSLLVFVNVLGKWVGVIVDAPAGSTSAMIGSGVKSNSEVQPNLVLAAENDSKIINNINLKSKSGDALVANNTRGGDATSGNATASANIANIANNTIGLSGWFGVLFINVFGNWFGSFGVDTPNGNPILNKPNTHSNSRMRAVKFIPRTNQQNYATVIGKNVQGQYEQEDMSGELFEQEQMNENYSNKKDVQLEAVDNSKQKQSVFNPNILTWGGAASVGVLSVAGVRRIRKKF